MSRLNLSQTFVVPAVRLGKVDPDAKDWMKSLIVFKRENLAIRPGAEPMWNGYMAFPFELLEDIQLRPFKLGFTLIYAKTWAFDFWEIDDSTSELFEVNIRSVK
jgi:hypothetical protein